MQGKDVALTQHRESPTLSGLSRIYLSRSTVDRISRYNCALQRAYGCRSINEYGSYGSAKSSGNAPLDRDDTVDSVCRNADVP